MGRLSGEQKYKLNKFVEENKSKYEGVQFSIAAKRISKEIGFKVTDDNIRTAKQETGVALGLTSMVRSTAMKQSNEKSLSIIFDEIKALNDKVDQLLFVCGAGK